MESLCDDYSILTLQKFNFWVLTVELSSCDY